MISAARVLAPASADQEAPLRAAVAALRGVASHEDAARLWGVELVQASPVRHVTVARCRSRARRAGTKVHRADLDDVGEVNGIPVTTAVRTVLDLCRTLPLPHAVAAADSALRQRLVTLPELLAAAAELAPALGRPQVREVVTRVDPLSGSVLESLCRLPLDDAGLRPFETQYLVRVASGTIGRVDFAWPEQRLVVEVDGYAFHADRSTYRNDRRRGNALVLAGWRVLRFSWEDVVGSPQVVVAQVRAALAR
jgi:hypothetical protein